MTVYLDGDWLPEDQARVSVFDRSFLYGDGLFETARAYGGRLFLWKEHWLRLTRGAAALGIRIPEAEAGLQGLVRELLDRNQLVDAVVRIHLSRGPGQRGYSPRGAERPTLVLTAHPASSLDAAPPAPLRLHTSSLRVPVSSPLAAHKTANKLLQILARAEAEAAGAEDALILNDAGHLAETSSANVFWFGNDHLCTPPLADGALPGVTREFLLRVLRRSGWSCSEVSRGPEALGSAQGILLTLTGPGVVEVGSLNGVPLGPSERVAQVRRLYLEAVRSELSG